jgi:hypothetical protein
MLSIERLRIWDKEEFSYTHDLLFIANQISFLKADRKTQDIITEINTFYNFRYPMEAETRDKVQKALHRIKGNNMGNSPLPGEISSSDWEKVEKLYNYILKIMPKDLYQIYQDSINQYE